MKINLSNEKLFISNELSLDKKLNFIYGKNGTGKSTLTKVIVDNYNSDSLKVCAFQGFGSIIGENSLLNAIVLGEKNKDIEKKIEEYNAQNKILLDNLQTLENSINKNIDGSKANQQKKLEDQIVTLNNKEGRFLRDAASEMSRLYDKKLILDNRTYNKNSIKDKIGEARIISDTEVNEAKETLYMEITDKVGMISYDLFKRPEDFLNEVNKVLGLISEEKSIVELPVGEEYVYLEAGIHLHKPGEKCKFCGNLISEERYLAIKKYFDADEVKAIKKEVDRMKEKIGEAISSLQKIKFDFNDLQEPYKEKIGLQTRLLRGEITKALNGFQTMKEALEKKNQFEKINPIILLEEVDYSIYIDKINEDITAFNNKIDNLNAEKIQARNILELHHIAIYISDEKYKVIQREKCELDISIESLEEEIKEIKYEANIIKDNIIQNEAKIIELVRETQSTEKLVNNINAKLEGLTNFKLVLQKDDAEKLEYYEIKNTEGEVRRIEELSTGEKNLIAFLYFLESLQSIEDYNKKKVIIFDDPMNSNDDTVQYFMMDQLNKLIKSIKKDSSQDIFVLLTHNIFFYQGLVYDVINIREQSYNPYEYNNFYKLVRINDEISIVHIKKKNDDFFNIYDGLWYELAFLYHAGKPRMMLNSMRRIIETFIIFTGIDEFYAKNQDIKRLLNVNSHGNVVFDVDTTSIGCDDLINMMKSLFKNNNYEAHFNKKWKHWKKHCNG